MSDVKPLFAQTFTVCGRELLDVSFTTKLFHDHVAKLSDEALRDLRAHPRLARDPLRGKMTVTLSWEY